MGVTENSSKQQTEPRESFLPDFCALPMVFAVVVTVELLAIVLSMVNSRTMLGFFQELSLYSLFVQWVALAGCALLCMLRKQLRPLSDGLAGLIAWALLMIITAVTSELAFRFYGEVLQTGDHLFFMSRNLIIAAITTALLLRYLYRQQMWRRQVVAESRARFQALQSRIRPHFLFNSMNTIASLTRSDPGMAEEVVHDLADLFRASLSDARTMSTLGEELELAEGYLRIETQRLGDRLQLEWALQDLPDDAPMPSLILQPLLENAVYHGIEPATEPGQVRIEGAFQKERVELGIRNSIPEGGKISQREGNRLALENVRQRLLALYEEQGQVTVTESDSAYEVRIRFPYQRTES
jgi:two-component system sensor histidine kinase AlgZ